MMIGAVRIYIDPSTSWHEITFTFLVVVYVVRLELRPTQNLDFFKELQYLMAILSLQVAYFKTLHFPKYCLKTVLKTKYPTFNSYISNIKNYFP